MTKKDVIAHEARLEERKTRLDAREQEISLREEKLGATLHAKDNELEAVVQQRTKELEDKHMSAFDTLATNSVAQLDKLTYNLAAASAAMTSLDQQVAKLTEDLSGSTKEVEALKEEARKAEIHLEDVRS